MDQSSTEEQAKAIAASFEVTDGPNTMMVKCSSRPAKLSDKFVMPFANVKAAQAANGGAYPPDMSVLAKARSGGVDYIYSVLLGYEDPPSGVTLDDGVYYNKYMYGNNIKMSQPLIGRCSRVQRWHDCYQKSRWLKMLLHF